VLELNALPCKAQCGMVAVSIGTLLLGGVGTWVDATAVCGYWLQELLALVIALQAS